jgi:hypothetical protein
LARTALDVIDVAFAIGALLAAFKSVATRSFLFTGNVLSATIIASILSFLLVSQSLKKKGVSTERIFIALTATVSGIWLYEAVYHYAYPNTPFAILNNLSTIDIQSGVGTYFPLPWAIIMVSLVFVGVRHMRLNKWFYLCVISTVIAFAMWRSIGYPQWMYPGKCFSTPIVHVVTRESSVLYGFLFNSITKFTVIPIPASLFLPKKR